MYPLKKHRINFLKKIDKTCWKTATGNNRVYLHVTFCGIFTIQQGLISCPLHGKTALNILKYNFVKQLKNDRKRLVKDNDIRSYTRVRMANIFIGVHSKEFLIEIRNVSALPKQ